MCHLLWADKTWMSRFRDTPPPVPLEELTAQYRDWMSLQSRHRDFDAEIVGRTKGLTADWLAANHTHFYPASGGRSRTHVGHVDPGGQKAGRHGPADDVRLTGCMLSFSKVWHKME